MLGAILIYQGNVKQGENLLDTKSDGEISSSILAGSKCWHWPIKVLTYFVL